jgi:hypothetical protein
MISHPKSYILTLKYVLIICHVVTWETVFNAKESVLILKMYFINTSAQGSSVTLSAGSMIIC